MLPFPQCCSDMGEIPTNSEGGGGRNESHTSDNVGGFFSLQRKRGVQENVVLSFDNNAYCYLEEKQNHLNVIYFYC